jgi:hypothetical protein
MPNRLRSRRRLVALEGRHTKRAIDLRFGVLPIQPAVVGQVGEDPL